VYLKYCGAHTTRWSGGDGTNFQNLNRTEKGFDPASYDTKGALRYSVVAPPGCKLLVYDASQIEARTLAWFAGQDDLVAAFAAGEDVYSKFASMIYNREIDPKASAADKTARFVGKVCVLGLGYGMGGVKLGNTLLSGSMGDVVRFTEDDLNNLGVNVDGFLRRVRVGHHTGEEAIEAIQSLLTHEQKITHFAVAEHIVNQYRKLNSKIKECWTAMERVIELMIDGTEEQVGPLKIIKNGLVLPSGLTLRYPELHYSESSESYTYKGSEPWPIKLYGGLLTENIIQALARCVISGQMLTLRDENFHIATMTHDEVVCVEPDETADERGKRMLEIFRTVPDWAEGLPLNAEGGVEFRYGDAK
jgi:DNA polymerase